VPVRTEQVTAIAYERDMAATNRTDEHPSSVVHSKLNRC
jgi:hypothetical protein